jgi:hypothetical protein
MRPYVDESCHTLATPKSSLPRRTSSLTAWWSSAWTMLCSHSISNSLRSMPWVCGRKSSTAASRGHCWRASKKLMCNALILRLAYAESVECQSGEK